MFNVIYNATNASAHNDIFDLDPFASLLKIMLHVMATNKVLKVMSDYPDKVVRPKN